MNGETSQNPFPTSADNQSSLNGGGQNSTVHRMAQKVHEAVDSLEQSLGAGSEKVMGWQQEYGDVAREQVRANPIAALGIAFAAGWLVAKVFR